MTKIKLCGLRRPEDILAANELKPDYIGFVFAPKSRRAVTPEQALSLRALLSPGIHAVGVFVDAPPEGIAELVRRGVLDTVQLHGREDAAYIARLRALTDAPVMQAFQVRGQADIARAESSPADLVLLDAGAGEGKAFDWTLLPHVRRPYLLAGGLTPENAAEAVGSLHPFGLDVSSGIETDGVKDPKKMRAFVDAVRGRKNP